MTHGKLIKTSLPVGVRNKMSGFIFLAAESTLTPHECEISRTKNTSVSVTNDNLRRANKVN